ncbi:MAG: glycine--tRNA ligase subunit alpha, partial [Lactobacillus amylovorus]|nr:glycine--tRNA ligase subunit alpha [Lactobacillus amylovorus]
MHRLFLWPSAGGELRKMADKKLNIQNMIFKLEQFWSSKG